MLDGKSILVVVPARGGSKGVPLKNIRPLAGVPLIAHTGNLVKRLQYVDRAICSTDHPDIAKAAADCGLEVPFMRPPELGGDLISDLHVLTHAIKVICDSYYDVVVMLQPTCPLRTAGQVTLAVRRLIDGGFDSVWTISETDKRYHPLKQLGLQGDELYYLLEDGRQIIARQQLKQTYYRNGAAYVFTRECLLEQQTTMGKRAGYVWVENQLVNIDTLEDFAEAERIMAARVPAGKGLGI
jgi:CMP-N,N'-diacetyllegionaminic acid synthase